MPWIFLILKPQLHFSQSTCTLRGTVTDARSQAPVPFAQLQLLPGGQGQQADSAGRFAFLGLSPGRYDLRAVATGYEAVRIPELEVQVARQTVVQVQLHEKTQDLAEVTVRPVQEKSRALNPFALLSSRTLKVEEAKRYAGGFDDPARLASAFAGVAGNTDNNGIMVRGNAPKYLQWRMEGVEIPNPNHFGDLRSIGGGVLTGLCSQMLASSDFMSGAFPAEYSNALSGVFDLNLRKGNAEKTERSIQLGLIGLETSQEGPFMKGKNATYLFNYRKASLALLEPLLPDNANTIQYQDLSFKLHFPTRKAGTFTVWGIGLDDAARANPKKDSSDWKYAEDQQQDRIKARVGAVGVHHIIYLLPNTYLKTSLSASGNEIAWTARRLDAQQAIQPWSHIGFLEQQMTASTLLNQKLNNRISLRSGLRLTQMGYRLNLNKAKAVGETPLEVVNERGQSQLFSAFASGLVQWSQRLEMSAGINVQYFRLNQKSSLEPRLGFRYDLGNTQVLSLGAGMHSRLEKLNYYLNNDLQTGARAVNRNLDFSKAIHVVLGYERDLNENLHLKLESYFQHLYQIPVVASGTFSMLNLQTDWFFAQALENKGLGRNVGLEGTLERSLERGYYYLISVSAFRSQYRAGDGKWRNTRFNREVVLNGLAGKEWMVGKAKRNVLGLNLRVAYQGGNWFAPVLREESLQAQEIRYDESRAFSVQADGQLNFHFTLSYRKNKERSSQEWALKILNLTGQPDFYGYKVNLKDQLIEKDIQSIVLPNLSWKVTF